MNGLKYFCCWSNTSEHVVYTSDDLTNATQYFLLYYNLISTEEPKAYNICLECLCGYLYPFTKPIPFREKKSYLCPGIDYKPLLISIKEKDNEILTQGETSGKNINTNETNNREEPK